MFNKMSLSARIVLIFSSLVFALIFTTTVFISLRLESAIGSQVRVDYQQITNGRASEMSQFLEKLYYQLRMIAIRNQIQTGDDKTVDNVVLKLKTEISPEVVDAFYTKINGDYFTSSGTRGNVADRDYFDAIVKKGQDYYIGDAVISKALGVPIIVLAKAVKDGNGALRGFIAFQIKLDKLSQIAASIKVARTGYGWFVDRNGLVIAHPNVAAVMKLKLGEADKQGYVASLPSAIA
jgi:methyl-accepting chemotaxis protein